jgi:hypothetical protein
MEKMSYLNWFIFFHKLKKNKDSVVLTIKSKVHFRKLSVVNTYHWNIINWDVSVNFFDIFSSFLSYAYVIKCIHFYTYVIYIHMLNHIKLYLNIILEYIIYILHIHSSFILLLHLLLSYFFLWCKIYSRYAWNALAKPSANVSSRPTLWLTLTYLSHRLNHWAETIERCILDMLVLGK